MVLTTAPPMIKTAARAPQSILLHFFATGFVVPEVDVAVSMASAAVISFFVRRGLGRARGACRHLAFSRPMPRASDDALENSRPGPSRKPNELVLSASIFGLALSCRWGRAGANSGPRPHVWFATLNKLVSVHRRSLQLCKQQRRTTDLLHGPHEEFFAPTLDAGDPGLLLAFPSSVSGRQHVALLGSHCVPKVKLSASRNRLG